MTTIRPLVACLGLLVAVAACDPAYTLGARTRLAPAPQVACVGTSLKASPRYAEVQPLDPREASGFRLTLHDSVLATGGEPYTPWRQATLRVEPAVGRDSTGAVSLAFTWLGDARSVPLVEQRHLLALAADVLAGLRTACAPRATPPAAECFAHGLGGAPACQPAA